MVDVVGERFNDAANPQPQQARELYTVDSLNDAIREKDVDKVREILGTKEIADLNAFDQHRWAPLHLAVCEESVECAWLLLAAGADPNRKSGEYTEDTPLSYAVLRHRAAPPIIKLLLQYNADPNLRPREDEHLPLLQAAKHGKETILKLLLDAGADIEGADRNGKTAAHYAAEAGHAGILRILGARGADLNKATGHYKYTPLIDAITSHNREAFDALLEHGASPALVHDEGNAPLMYATWAGETGMVGELARHGVSLDAQNTDGYSALMWAADAGKQYAVEKLLELGANPLLRNGKGLSAANIARENGHDDLAALLDVKAAMFSIDGKQRQPKSFRISLGVKNG